MQKDFIFGIRAVIEAVEAGKTINKILLQKGVSNPLMRELTAKLARQRHLIQHVPLQKLNTITRKNHQGAIAFIAAVDYTDLETLVPSVFESGEVPLFVVLDRVTDVRNFGAIARTAECMGVHGIITTIKGGASVNADAVKTSAGALMRLPVCRVKYLDDALTFLKNSGLQLVGSTEKTDQVMGEVDLSPPTALVMGSEEDGISPKFMALLDHRAKIPMPGTIASLNVSVAAGMALYEVVKQRLR